MPFFLRKTVSETFLERVRVTPNSVGFQFKKEKEWTRVTFGEFYADCRLVSFGLLGLGIQPRDKVVILSNTRYEWSLCDMAILGAGAITVPIYAANTQNDVLYIMNHCEARIAILEDAKQLHKIIEKRMQDPSAFKHLEKIVVIDSSAMTLAGKYLQGPAKDVLTLDALKELGRREEARGPGRFVENLNAAQPGDLITICYTSGTTGIPKGVMLTHDNMMSVLEDTVSLFGKYLRPESEVVLSFLPFSHVLGKVESMATYTLGWRQAFAESIDKVMTNLMEVRPTLIFSVPRTFEKAELRIREGVARAPVAQRKIFETTFEAGWRYFEAMEAKKRPAMKDFARYKVGKASVFRKVRERFGGRLRYAVCGAAPLSKEIGRFFQILGIQILEGYGLTETCAPVTINTPDHLRLGSVGKPMPDVTIKIAQDGEILIQSRKVFQGYYKMPQETKEALRDAWLHTGDLGTIDAEGYLHITDRKKDLIITSGGKNVAPQKIETMAVAHPVISHFLVHGDKRPYLTALVTLDHEQIIRYATENQILFSEYSELIKNPRIIALIQTIIDDVNRHLSSYETIKRFVILPNEFTVESGELTPSLKARRGFISQRYRALLDSLYESKRDLDSASDIR